MSEMLKEFITTIVSVLLAIVSGTVSLFPANLDRLEVEKAEQIERIDNLKTAYVNGEIAPVDESSFFDGDLEKELQDGLKFNELRFIATHNSYQTEKTHEYKELYGNVSDLTVGIVDKEKAEFYSETLTTQLNMGIRSLEMDIETIDDNGNISFTCMHAPYTDMTTSCYDFALALEEIKMWSDNNPNHLPITIIIEPKSGFLPMENMKEFNVNYAIALDDTLKNTLGDKLFTPGDMLRNYNSFGEMRAADDWCRVENMLGKVLILLHECDVTEKYISLDDSIKSQAMFPMLRENDVDRDSTSFILANDPNSFIDIKDEVLFDKKIVARTRADKYAEVSSEQRSNALNCKAQIVSTDYPPREDNKNDDVFSFGNGKTISTIK